MNEESLNLLNNKLYETDWSLICSQCDTIDKIYEKLEEKYKQIFDSIIKTKQITVKTDKYPKDILKLIYKRRKLRKKSGFDQYFTHKYNYITKQIEKMIESFESKKITKLISKSDNLFKFYKHLKTFNDCKNNDIFLDSNDSIISRNDEIVSEFAQYFQSNYNSRDNDISNINFNEFNHKLPDIYISMNDILQVYKKFKFNRAQGLTFITNRILKSCLNGSTKLLFFLFNRIIDLKEIPNKMLLTKVSPILKKHKNRHRFNSYRGVSVQSNLLRIFESIILSKITPFLNDSQAIPSEQYGYKKSISISFQHIDIQKHIYDSLNDKDVFVLMSFFSTSPMHLMLCLMIDY